MLRDLISNKSLSSKNLIYEDLAGSGLTSPRSGSTTPVFVWILFTSTLPQPGNQIGTWVDIETWNDSPEVWYD